MFEGSFSEVARRIKERVSGQGEAIELCLCALCAKGHVLIEGAPGSGKTLLAKSIAWASGLSFGRVQATPDLTAKDILRPDGPFFKNIVLIDEINRAPARVQSAMFEAMQEGQITTGSGTKPLGVPFMVIATMNPHDHFSTNMLSRPHLDRFMFRTGMSELDVDAEISLMEGGQEHERLGSSSMHFDACGHIRACSLLRVPKTVLRLCHDMIRMTRSSRQTIEGASVRCAVSFANGVRGMAYIRGKEHACIEEAFDIAVAAIAHRILMCPDSEGFGYGGRELVLDIKRRAKKLYDAGAELACEYERDY